MADKDIQPGEQKPILATSDASSMLKLKAELLKKTTTAKSSRSAGDVRSTKASILRGPKKDIDRKMSEKNERKERKAAIRERSAKEIEMEERRQKIMEEKSRVYERMSRGGTLVGEEGRAAEFLVNFLEKRDELQEEAGNHEIEERTERYDRSSRSPSRERSPEKPLVERYMPFEERRVYGASHVIFSKDEEERQKEMDALLALSTETASIRNNAKEQAEKTESEVNDRLKELRSQFDLPEPEPKPTLPECEAAEDVPLDTIPLPGPPAEKRPRRDYGVREWDIGKEREFRYMESRRDERDDEFQPPSSYYH